MPDSPRSENNKHPRISSKTNRLSIYHSAFWTIFKKPRLVDINSLPVVCMQPTPIDYQHLRNYQNICGFTRNKEVPITYPQVTGFYALMTLMTHKNFSLPVVGMVHTHNKIERFDEINCMEPIAQETKLLSCEKVDKGFLCTIEVLTRQNDCVVNRVISHYLYRVKTRKQKSKSTSQSNQDLTKEKQSGLFEVNEKLIRRYARISGDINPIHLSHLTAKLFGFKKMIAHGMWSIARVIAETSSQLQRASTKQNQLKEVEVHFKKPIYLPSELTLNYDNRDKEISLSLTSNDRENLHLQGTLKFED